MSINKVIISGNLTRDPELNSTPGGTSLLKFGVAVNDRKRNAQTNEWEDVANFVDCVIFGARAEGLSKVLAKGMKCAIEGKLHYSSWTTDGGQKRSKLDVYVDEIEFLSQRNQQATQKAPQQAPQTYQPQYQQPQQYQAAPQQYQQPAQYPQGYAQPAQQPQQSQMVNYPPQQQYAPQQASQAPVQAQLPQQPVQAQPPQYPQGYQQPAQAAQQDIYDEDIPF